MSKELRDKSSASRQIQFYAVSCAAHSDVCKDFEVQAFPSVVVFRPDLGDLDLDPSKNKGKTMGSSRVTIRTLLKEFKDYLEQPGAATDLSRNLEVADDDAQEEEDGKEDNVVDGGGDGDDDDAAGGEQSDEEGGGAAFRTSGDGQDDDEADNNPFEAAIEGEADISDEDEPDEDVRKREEDIDNHDIPEEEEEEEEEDKDDDEGQVVDARDSGNDDDTGGFDSEEDEDEFMEVPSRHKDVYAAAKGAEAAKLGFRDIDRWKDRIAEQRDRAGRIRFGRTIGREAEPFPDDAATSTMKAHMVGTKEFDDHKEKLLDSIRRHRGRSIARKVEESFDRPDLSFKKYISRPKFLERVPVMKRLSKMSYEEELMLDISLS